MAEPTRLDELARLRHGEKRAGELKEMAANLAAALEIVAQTKLDGADEPDFLDGSAAE